MLVSACGKGGAGGNAKGQDQNNLQDNNTITEIVTEARDLLQDGQVIKVRETVEDYCGGIQSNYSIKRSGDSVQLLLNLAFSPDESLSNEAFENGIRKTRSCIPYIKKFYSKYNIDFDINFFPFYSALVAPDNQIVLTGKNTRSNSLLFSLKDGTYCKMVLHEVGHHLGLRDEYYEAGTCRAKAHAARERNPHSLMETIYENNLALFPRHFRTILGPALDLKEHNYPYELNAEDLGNVVLELTSKRDNYLSSYSPYMSSSAYKGLKNCLLRNRTTGKDDYFILKQSTSLSVLFESEKVKEYSHTRKLDGSRDSLLDVTVSLKFIDAPKKIGFTHLECRYMNDKAGIEGLKEVLKDQYSFRTEE